MENNADWLARNKTWKKWTRIGDGELLSYAGINFEKPTDEEQFSTRKRRDQLTTKRRFTLSQVRNAVYKRRRLLHGLPEGTR
jgi:hypothetical protein